ncbi:MAG: chemotaxis protein CheB [Cyanobacteria bacterium J06588_4]
MVGIGASADGLSALEKLFDYLPTTTGAAFVVVQHLSPDFKSLMKELLERNTSMPIYRIKDGIKLQPNSVYLIPPGQNLALEGRVLRSFDRKKDENQKHELNFPIDLFFTSLAHNFGEQSIGVVLSGTGSDGTRGLKSIVEAGGIALVQAPETAEFDGMPLSAIATGVINRVLPPRELAQLIHQCIVAPASSLTVESSQKNSLVTLRDLDRIAKILLEEEELDFAQYKPSTISRRIHRRFLIHGSVNIDEYIDLLINSSRERKILCSDLLINVTHFFRNYPAWQHLENKILPQLIEQSPPSKELRFWITACSTGEEAYSLAILIDEALQNTDKDLRVKIFATDIDRLALEKASQGIYPTSIAREVGKERLQNYFVAKDNSFQVMRKIREMLIFSPHDLTRDAGFTRIDLVTCRNVLIYMKPNLQDRILRNLHFSLVAQGVLFLGEAETLGAFESEFESLDQKWKLFRKRRDIKFPLSRLSTQSNPSSSPARSNKALRPALSESLLEQCLNRLSHHSNSVLLIVSQDCNLLQVNGDSSRIFKAIDGKITTAVTKMVVPSLQLPLNTALHRAKQEGEVVKYQDIKVVHQGETLNLALEVMPPKSDPLGSQSVSQRQNGNFFLVKIEFESTIAAPEIIKPEQFEAGNVTSQRLLELEQELQQTQEDLQTLVEELETTNQKLEQRVAERTKSLAQFGKRLQLLHRLATSNYQQQQNLFNDYLQTGCQMLNLGTGIVSEINDCVYKIVAVNSSLGLEIGYETPCQDTYCAEVVETKTTITFCEVGKIESMVNHPVYLNLKLESFISTPIFVNGNLYGTLSFSDTIPRQTGFSAEEISIVELMARDLGNVIASAQAKQEIEQKERRFRSTFEQAAVGVAHVSPDGKFIQVNQRLCSIVDYDNETLLSKTFQEITYADDLELDLQYFGQLLADEIQSYSMEKRYIRRDGSLVWINLTVSLIRDSQGEADYFIAVIEDIGDRKQTELALEQSRDQLKQANLAKDNFIAHMSHELRTPLNSIIGFSHILQQDSDMTPEQLRSIDLVHQSGQHLLTLINDVLQLSKLNADKLQLNYCDFNLIELLHNIIAMFQVRAQEKSLNFVSQIASDLPEIVNTDETRLRQVLLNLLSNAFKFTAQGNIIFSVIVIQHTANSETAQICFQVEDTGKGIATSDYQTIFTAFEQLEPNGDSSEGTGLGLSICQNILQLMDSELHLVSTVGEGSRFWFNLNLKTIPPSFSSISELESSETNFCRKLANSCRALVVDDNYENRLLLLEYLEPLGFSVEQAENGHAGLAIAKSFQPDVILVDLLMPIMDGKEMIELIRQDALLQDTLILMISANVHLISDESAIN